MKILVMIPARGGSKGIPLKNIVNVCGKPLIAYTYEALCPLIEKYEMDVVLSTDSFEIAEIAKGFGIGKVDMRPEELASDTSKTIDLVKEYLARQKQSYDLLMLLQPTSPLRTTQHIDAAIAQFKNSRADSLISVYEEEVIKPSIMYKYIGGKVSPLSKDHNSGKRRQDDEKIYIRNGGIYLVRMEFFKEKSLLIGNTPDLFIMSKEDSINIDSWRDLDYLRWHLCR